MRHLGQSLNICNTAGRVTHRLHKDCTSILVDEFRDILCAITLGQTTLDAYVAQRDNELVVSTSIEVGRCHDIFTRLSQGRHGEKYGRHSRCGSQSAYTTIEGRDTLLVSRRCRVVEASIDIAWLTKGE